MPHKPRYRRRPQRDFRRPDLAERQPPASGAAPVISATISGARPVVAPQPLAARTVQPAAAPADFRHVKREMKRIAVIAGAMFAILVILSFFLR
ncbi:MAG: hypothetical protein HY673_06300 [Chloroflexi bacterium]|nr:hypothetical protein [Chloroflexota bacterium]